jgi:competence protein ComEC
MLLGGTGGVGLSRWRDWRPARLGCWLVVMVAVGGYWSHCREPGTVRGIGQLIQRSDPQVQLLRVRGHVLTRARPLPQAPQDVLEAFRFGDPQLRFVIAVDAYQADREWLPTTGRLDCQLQRPRVLDEDGVAIPSSEVPAAATELAVGQRVELLGQVSLPPPPKNPGQFDQRRFLWLAGLQGELRLTHPGQIHILEDRPHWTSAGLRWRDYFKQLLERHLAAEQHPMAAAVLLGDRSMLDSQLRHQYAATGTVHVLAISGLHLGILAGSLLWLARWSWIPQRPILWLTIALVVFYAWLVEFRPPIVRAAVLTTALCVATLIGRRAFSINSLAVALCVVFAIEPHQIAEPGTQLSFLAVTAIVVFVHRRGKRVPDPLQELRESQETPLQRQSKAVLRSVGEVYLCGGVVSLVCLPLVMHYFHLGSWIGILINPLVIVPMSLALLSGFGLLVTAPFSTALGDLFGSLCGASLATMHGIVEFAYQIPGSHLWVTSPGWLWIVTWYVGGGLWVWWAWGQPSDRSVLRARVLGVAIAFWLAAYLWPQPRFPDRWAASTSGATPLTLTMIDVGHGNAALLRTPAGRVLLFDAGSFPSAQAAGQRIGGVLLAHGILRIDQLLISHADLDHYNGVPELLRRFAVRQVIMPEGLLREPTPHVQFLAQTLDQSAALLRHVQAGDRIWEEDDLSIEVLSPPPGGFADGDNSNSLVLLIRYGENRLLLTGDLEGAGQDALMAGAQGPFSVVQVPHHGSRQSRPESFAQWSRPQLAVISGLQRRVARESRQAWEAVGATVHLTDQDGAILINLFPDGTHASRAYLEEPWSTR